MSQQKKMDSTKEAGDFGMLLWQLFSKESADGLGQ
jgi:hypothetical protein